MTTPLLPLIGIPCRHGLSQGYRKNPLNAVNNVDVATIAQAGGLPFLIPLQLETAALRKLFDLADGILLTGGGDVDPAAYNQSPTTTLYNVQPERDQTEITLARWAMAEGKPMLGICRGSQVLAVAAGGTLIQDLPSQLPQATLHSYLYQRDGSPARDELVHTVELTPTCQLAKILQTTSVPVNSLHHQAVDSLPGPLQVVGRSPDGVIEATELPGHPFFCGVQWHPELLVAEHESARRVIRGFVAACESQMAHA